MNSCQPIQIPDFKNTYGISNVRIIGMTREVELDDKTIRLHVLYLNDKLHKRTFMNRDQFFDTIQLKFSAMTYQCYGVTIPASHKLLYEADLKSKGNYYPEYIRLLSIYPEAI